MRKHVLVVSQDVTLRAKIARMLQPAGYAVELAAGEKRALELAAGAEIEAAIVVPGPGSADLGWVQELRAAIPRMVVVADQADAMDRLASLLPGLETVSLQPLNDSELLDRLAHVLSKPANEENETAPPILLIGAHRLDLEARTFLEAGGRKAPLTRAECTLLAALARGSGRVLSRDQLSRAVAGRGAEPYDRNIDMLIARLRRKIEPDPKTPQFILTERGQGYRVAARPQIADRGANSVPSVELKEPMGAETTSLRRLELQDTTPATPAAPGALMVQPEPERRQLTMLSCGLVGSVALAANLDPEVLSDVIRRFHDACNSAIRRWGGVIASSTSDEILAVFGYPVAREDDAERAARAGLDLVALGSELRSPSGEPLQMRVGIATGVVLVSQNQAFIGEPPIVAARLRTVAAANSVMITVSTRRLLGTMFRCDGPEPCELEGVSEAIPTFRIRGERAVESRFRAMRPEKPTHLVGRQHEMQQLSALWEQAKLGKGQVALLCGEAGIGKSRIREAFVECIAQEPHTTLRYQCSPHHINSPFYPVINRLEHVAGFEQGDGPDVKFEKLKVVLSQASQATLADAALYAALLSIPANGRYSVADLLPKQQKDHTIAALIRQALNLVQIRPLIIVVADAHWIDSSSLELLSRTIASIKAAQVLVLVEFRPEFFPPWLDQSHVTMLRLDRLRREHAAAIISDIAGGKELPPEVSEQIISKTDGVPLFIEELTKMVIESGLLGDAGDRYFVSDPLPPLAIPSTLLDSLMARLDRLGPIKEIAQIGAAIGREFSYRLIAAVAPGPSLQAALTQLAASELIFARGEAPDSTYIFKNALVRDAAYATLLRSKRQQLHDRVANVLLEAFPETVETQPEVIAHHLAHAGHTERAIEYLIEAGQRTIERSANVEAIGHLTRALDLLESRSETPERAHRALTAQVMLGQAKIAHHGFAARATKETLLRAKTLMDESTDPAQKLVVLYGVWASRYVGGDVAVTDAAAELLAEAEQHGDPPALCIAHRTLGTNCLIRGDFAAGLRHLERSRALYDPEQHAQLRYHYAHDIGTAALCYLSWGLWHVGYVDRASDVAAEAIKRAEELSHPHTLVYTICHLRGIMEIFRRRPGNMRSTAGLVISLCAEHGFVHWAACGRILEGWSAICDGKLEQGIAVLREGVAAWRQAGARLWLPTFLALEAEAYAASGRNEAALRVTEEALAGSESSGERWMSAELLRIKARLLLATERASDEVEALLVHSLETARRQQARCYELRAACDLARLWQGQNRGKQALQLVQSTYDQFTEGLETRDLQEARTLIESLSAARSPP